QDYHATHNGAPRKDDSQDVELLGAEQNDTHTILNFRRRWRTCDHDHDLPLGDDTVRVIWATHFRDPKPSDQFLPWHGKDGRGTHSLYLRSGPTSTSTRIITGAKTKPVRHWDVKMSNLLIPDDMDTLYWCKIFKLPALGKKHHLIGHTPIIDPSQKNTVHHMLLYECVSPRAQDVFPRYVAHEGAACYSPSMPVHWESCLTPVIAWAVGSEGEFLPEHVGIPLSESDHDTFFMLEVHYDNPTFKMARDNSGIRIHFTEELRPFDGGVLSTGIPVTQLHLIPPYQPGYTSAGFCSQQCTNKMFPEDGIKVVSVVLHSHLAGRKMRLRHIRAGNELAPIVEDNHYDFKYQQARVLKKEKTVYPGDELITECVYETSNRSEPTFGGFSTKEEMCLAFILHYPRMNLAVCNSMTPVKAFFATLGVREFYNMDMSLVEHIFLQMGSRDQIEALWNPRRTTASPSASGSLFPDHPPGGGHIDDEANQKAISILQNMKEYSLEPAEGAGITQSLFTDLQIRLPLEFQNKSFAAHLIDLPWAESLLTQRIEESFRHGPHMTFCRLKDDQLALPAVVQPFPNITTPLEPTDPLRGLNCPARKGATLEHLSFSGASSSLFRPALLLLSAVLLRC
ncbi:hypothetical protein B566_EDAN007799, partial [Ephemera danica]